MRLRMNRKIVTSVFLFTLTFLSSAHKSDSLQDASPVRGRPRRSLISFAAMIECAANRSSLDYNGYGCFCGLGGSGTAVDELDRCCEVHDSCYRGISSQDSSCNVYLSSYSYSKDDCRTFISSIFDLQPEPQIECHDSENTDCEQTLCECDRVAALCFAQAGYNEEYSDYDKAANCQDPVQGTSGNPSPTPTTGAAFQSPGQGALGDPTGAAPRSLIPSFHMMCVISASLSYIVS